MDLSEIIRRAIEIGTPSGEITFDQVNDLCGTSVEPEDIEFLFDAQAAANIRLEP